MEEDKSVQILSDLTTFMKYARYVPELKRRETWEELIDRNKEMHIRKFPTLKDEIEYAYSFVYNKKVLPSMRSLQFAGKPIELNNARMFNCAYLPIDTWETFHEIMFLLLGGSGVGYSLQKSHISQLPEIRRPTRKRKYVIGDSIEGWADAIKVLIKGYFANGYDPRFVYDDIREKGARLITSGGKAPGPEPLRDCLHNIRKILDRKQNGDRLTSIDCHHIITYIADCVLSGGIRRAALIAFFDIDDQEMIESKYGQWWEENPHFGRANNSAVLLRYKLKKKDFYNYFDKMKNSGSGDPGFALTNNPNVLFNPCGEASLHKNFCNLVTVPVHDLKYQDEFNERVRVATFISTLQCSYTDFHFLRDVWKKNTEKEALLGVSLTGIATQDFLKLNLEEAAIEALNENERVAKIIGVNKSARITLNKPEGTASLVAGCSSGIHAWYDKYYIRRIRVGKNESIYKYLIQNHPQLVEDDYFKSSTQAVISIPVKSPDGAIIRSEESPIELLERIKRFTQEWIKPAHRSGDNTHSVSCTIEVKDDEWDEVCDWMWKNIEDYNCLTVLPYDGGSHIQAPFESCNEETYNELYKVLKNVDFSQVIEEEDETDLAGEIACGSGGCEIK